MSIIKICDVFDSIELPCGTEDIALLKNKKTGEPIFDLEHKEQLFLAQMVSEEAKADYTLLSLQSAYDRLIGSQQFRMLMYDRWMANREVVLKSDYVIPNPKVRISSGKLVYYGDKVPVSVNKKTAYALREARLFKGSYDLYDGDIYFNEEGEASVWSGIKGSCGGKLSVLATWPMKGVNCPVILERV